MDTPYRQPQEPPPQRVVRLADLLPETVARLEQACRWHGSPGLLGSDRPPQRPRWPRVVGSLAALVALGLCGWLASGATTPDDLERVGVLWGLGLTALASARSLQGRDPGVSPQLEPGLYLFARELIDVRSTVIRVFLTEAIDVARSRKIADKISLALRGGDRFTIGTTSETPLALAREIERVRGLIERAEVADDHAALDILDPLRAERGRWEHHPAAALSAPGEWPGRVAAVAGTGLLALGLALGAEGWSIHRAAAAHDSDALARLSRARLLLAGQADAAWLQLALDGHDERRLVHYSIAGRHPERAREALAARDGVRCQSDACWGGVRDACRMHDRLDVGLLERSMPYRSDRSPIPLAVVARWCPDALPYRELARLDLRNASLSPPLLQLLWGYARDPHYGRPDDDEVVLAAPGTQKPRPETPELREISAQAESTLLVMYAAEREEVRRREQTPWAQAQGALLEALARHNLDVAFSVRHERAPAPVKPGDIPAEIDSALEDHALHRTSPLLRLGRHRMRETILYETLDLTLRVTWQQRSADEPLQAIGYEWAVTIPTQKGPLRFPGKFPEARALPAPDPAAFAAAFF